MISRLLATEASFDPLLHPYRERADRIMVGMNLFLFVICLAITPYRNTYAAALAIGLPTLLLSIWLMRRLPGALLTRLYMGCAFMAYTGLIIHQSGGDIEAHFSAFGLIAVLLYYRDWRTITAATVFIYLHHLVLGYAQTLGVPIYVFDENRFWTLFGLHVAYFLPFVGMMGYLAIWLRREGYEEQHVIALAQQIVQGNLVEDDTTTGDAAKTPLIAAVRQMKSRLLDLLRVMPVAAAVIRIDTETVVNVNEAWIRTIGTLHDSATRFGASPIWADPATWAMLMARIRDASEKLLDKEEVVLRKSDGTPILCELSLILHEDIVPVMAILTVEDVTLRRKAEETMQHMLTDLPNRASLHQAAAAALEAWQSARKPFAIVMMDLDGFKPVNDTYGHDAGDEVLRVIGARLAHVNRVGDTTARLGGDEFAIVLNDCPSVASAAEVAQRCIEAVARPIRLNIAGVTIKVGASAGVAYIGDVEANVEALLKAADTALYAAKTAGKNRVEAYKTSRPASADF